MDQVEEVKKKTDIVALISETVQLKKAGRNFKGVCPFHSEKTPSFMVTPELQIFKCFGCGLGGDVFRFVMEQEKVEFPQALKILADRAGVKLKPLKGFASYQEKDEILSVNFLSSEFYHYILTTHLVGQKARDYLKRRGVKEESIKTFKLGFSPEKPDALLGFLTKKRNYKPELLEKSGIVVHSSRGYFDRFRGRIIFPLKDHFGNVQGFAGRVLEEKGDMAKYINSPETLVYKKGNILYGLETTKNEVKTQGFVVIVEGELDCISCFEAGIGNVVAIKGSAITPEQAQLLARFTQRVVLALDADFAGDQASRRGLDILAQAGLTVQIASLGEFKDPDDMAKKAPEKLKRAIETAEGMYDYLINSTIRRFGIETTEEKAKVSRELTPILASIDDEIIRAHCIKQVAIKLGVPEEAVAAQIRKSGVASIAKNPFIETAALKTRNRRDVLEEHFLAHLFQITPDSLKIEETRDLVKIPVHKKLLDYYQKFKVEVFNPVEFANSLPPELSDLFTQLLLIETEENPERVEVEQARLVKELEMMEIKEEINSLTEQIQQNEAQEKLEEVSNLQRELSELGSKLANLEAQVYN